MSEIITFISGKGGVGKTALCSATGKLLSEIGYKVLLIDSDLVTHGMTFLLGFNKESKGILELHSNLRKHPIHLPTEHLKNILERSQKKVVCKI
jgi:cellulose biosynthesis protein BcsQ